MQFVHLAADVHFQIIEMLHPHGAANLKKTCTTMHDVYSRISHRIESNIAVTVVESKLQVALLSGRAHEYRENTDHWMSFEDAVNEPLLAPKLIRRLTIKKSNLTMGCCGAMSDFFSNSKFKVDQLIVNGCTLPKSSVPIFGQLMGDIGAEAIRMYRIPFIGMLAHKIIPYCMEKTAIFEFHYWGFCFLTLRQCWTLQGNLIPGYKQWFNPEFMPDPSFKYESIHFQQYKMLWEEKGLDVDEDGGNEEHRPTKLIDYYAA